MVIPMEKETRVEEGDILDKQYDTENNCIENLSKQMSLHPAYLKAFQRTEQFLMSGNGPLPFTHRHYIAIMASGRHQCETLVQLESAAFRAVGGDENWLTQGLQAAPSKLSRLCTLNNLLAHRPWLIQRHHIEELTTSNVKCSWSLSELMQAITILSQYHALSSFVFSCAINTGNNSMCLSNLLKRLKQEKKVSEYSEEELIESFKYIENQDLKYSMNKPQPNSNRCTNGGIGARLQRDPGFAYEDFAKRSTATSTLDSSGGRHATPHCPATPPLTTTAATASASSCAGAPYHQPPVQTLRARDYSWQDHGYGAANRLYPDIGNLLDDKFQTITNLTYHTMGDNADIDTSDFRLAIWNYIHCLFGIRHDDYDYQKVNEFLERPLKNYIKTVACYPERCTAGLVSDVPSFQHSEKVHIDLMIIEARLQASLLYGLRSLMDYHNHQ